MSGPAWWLAYGGGVNSTALLIMLVEGKLPQYAPWRVVFSDTGNEKDETYAYIERTIKPYLAAHGRELEIVTPPMTVLERWQFYKLVGNRTLRHCTDHAKIRPITALLKREGCLGQLIGIDAGEAHRAKANQKDKWKEYFPLVDLDIDRDGCMEIIRDAGLCVPKKSGCWHCPFMRVAEILELAKTHPKRMAQIEELERVSLEHTPQKGDSLRAQWHNKPASYWRLRANGEIAQGQLFEMPPEIPCGCYDGGGSSDDEAANDAARKAGEEAKG